MKIKPYFLYKIKVKLLKCRLLQFLFDALRVNRMMSKIKDILSQSRHHYETSLDWLISGFMLLEALAVSSK